MSKYKTFTKEKWLYFAFSIITYFLPFIIVSACLLPIVKEATGLKIAMGLGIMLINAIPFLMGIFKAFFAHFPICDKLFSDDEKFNNLKKLLSDQKIIDINIVNYTNGKIADCYFYFKDAKNVSDLISVLDELGYTDDEYKLIEIGGRI